ncbi:MAG: YdeI/OmpD-associated family protein [Taibaiella sp.]|nr:YdeI/OmpD-associated family protein [Taibaiella sp.]
MSTYDPRVDAYIEKSADFAKPILSHLRDLIHTACPDVVETWKWSFPNFDYNGSTICNMAAFKQHCSFGFWKASIMEDPDGILTVTEREAMGHLGKITSLGDLPKDAILKKYIKQAMKLNDEGVKKASPRKVVSDKEKAALKTPPDFAALLKQNKVAEKVFSDFSYSHRKEYIAWFDEAKTDATRAKRMTQALEWIAEGKSRNWKYQR